MPGCRENFGGGLARAVAVSALTLEWATASAVDAVRSSIAVELRVVDASIASLMEVIAAVILPPASNCATSCWMDAVSAVTLGSVDADMV